MKKYLILTTTVALLSTISVSNTYAGGYIGFAPVDKSLIHENKLVLDKFTYDLQFIHSPKSNGDNGSYYYSHTFTLKNAGENSSTVGYSGAVLGIGEHAGFFFSIWGKYNPSVDKLVAGKYSKCAFIRKSPEGAIATCGPKDNNPMGVNPHDEYRLQLQIIRDHQGKASGIRISVKDIVHPQQSYVIGTLYTHRFDGLRPWGFGSFLERTSGTKPCVAYQKGVKPGHALIAYKQHAPVGYDLNNRKILYVAEPFHFTDNEDRPPACINVVYAPDSGSYGEAFFNIARKSANLSQDFENDVEYPELKGHGFALFFPVRDIETGNVIIVNDWHKNDKFDGPVTGMGDSGVERTILTLRTNNNIPVKFRIWKLNDKNAKLLINDNFDVNQGRFTMEYKPEDNPNLKDLNDKQLVGEFTLLAQRAVGSAIIPINVKYSLYFPKKDSHKKPELSFITHRISAASTQVKPKVNSPA